MPISYRSSSTYSDGTTNSSFNIPAPAGVSNLDVMIAVLQLSPTSTPLVVTAPTGWVFIRQDDRGSGYTQRAYYKVAGGSEPASYNFTTDVNVNRNLSFISAFIGVKNSSPIDIHGGQGTGSTAPVTAPSITTTVANTMLVGAFGVVSESTFTPPAGMTEDVDILLATKTRAIEGTHEAFVGPGATGTRDAVNTLDGNEVGQLFALAPETGDGTKLLPILGVGK